MEISGALITNISYGGYWIIPDCTPEVVRTCHYELFKL